MSNTHPSYPPEFRSKVVALVRSGRGIREVAREFKLSDQSVRNWLKQEALDSGRRNDGLTSAEREELTRLRRENKRLRSAWVKIQPADSTPSGSQFDRR